MSRRKAEKDLQNYFDSLLADESQSGLVPETQKPISESLPIELESVKDSIATPEPNAAEEKRNFPMSEKALTRSYKPEPKPSLNLSSLKAASGYLTPPQLDTHEKTEAEAAKALPFDDRSLQQEKKQELQKLLSQSAFFSKAEVSLEPSVKVDTPVEQKLSPAPEVELEAPVELDVPEGVGQVDPEEYDSFHVDQNKLIEWAENGRPVWAQEKFEVLLFEVSGLTLAVPLISLGQIFPLSEELTPIFGQAEWMMGLMPTTLGKLRIVNTALFVMPEKYDAEFTKNAKYVVSIDGVPWALAVDRVNQPISLEPSDIRWRGERGKRPWLAGTVKSAMCALLDIPQMSKLLSNTDKSLRRQPS